MREGGPVFWRAGSPPPDPGLEPEFVIHPTIPDPFAVVPARGGISLSAPPHHGKGARVRSGKAAGAARIRGKVRSRTALPRADSETPHPRRPSLLRARMPFDPEFVGRGRRIPDRAYGRAAALFCARPAGPAHRLACRNPVAGGGCSRDAPGRPERGPRPGACGKRLRAARQNSRMRRASSPWRGRPDSSARARRRIPPPGNCAGDCPRIRPIQKPPPGPSGFLPATFALFETRHAPPRQCPRAGSPPCGPRPRSAKPSCIPP